MNITLIRTIAMPERTFGYLLLGPDPIGYTLEDTLRLCGPKVPGKTAIPAGTYVVTIEPSHHFKRLLPRLHNVPGFEGVLIHGGNTEADTEGCILVAKSRLKDEKIYNSQSANLVQALQNYGGTHTIKVINP